MPKSRLRRRSPYTPPGGRATTRVGSPSWLVPAMTACFVVGLLWIVVYYITQTDWPIRSIGNWNIAVGFALIMLGFTMSTRWK